MPSFDRLNKRALTLITSSTLIAWGVKTCISPQKGPFSDPQKI